MTDVDSEILTLNVVAADLKAHNKPVYRLAQQGQMPGFKLAACASGRWEQ